MPQLGASTSPGLAGHAVPEAGCLPGDGGGRLRPSGHCAPRGRAIPHGIWPQHGAKATEVMQHMASGARDEVLTPAGLVQGIAGGAGEGWSGMGRGDGWGGVE